MALLLTLFLASTKLYLWAFEVEFLVQEKINFEFSDQKMVNYFEVFVQMTRVRFVVALDLFFIADYLRNLINFPQTLVFVSFILAFLVG